MSVLLCQSATMCVWCFFKSASSLLLRLFICIRMKSLILLLIFDITGLPEVSKLHLVVPDLPQLESDSMAMVMAMASIPSPAEG